MLIPLLNLITVLLILTDIFLFATKRAYPLALDLTWLLLLVAWFATLVFHHYALLLILLYLIPITLHARTVDRRLQARRARTTHPSHLPPPTDQ